MQIARFAKISGKDVGVVLKDETRLLVKAFVARTPPYSGKELATMGAPGWEGTAFRIGADRVARDIRRVYKTSEDLGMFNQPELQKLLRKGNVEGLEKVFKEKELNFLKVTEGVDPWDHKSQRISRGRVKSKPLRTFVIRKAALNRYISERQKRVGMAKAGWMKAAATFGVPLPTWVTDIPQPGIAEDKTANTEDPSVVAANLVPWAQRFGDDLDTVSEPVRFRSRAIQTKIEAAISKAWEKVKPSTPS